MKGYTTAEFADVLAHDVHLAGHRRGEQADEVVSVGTARVKEIRQVNSASVVFVVAGTQNVTAKSGDKELVEEYAVTVIEVGTDWRVYDLQPADSGQEGDDRPRTPAGR